METVASIKMYGKHIAQLWRGGFCSVNARQHFDLYFGNAEKEGTNNILLCLKFNQNHPNIMLKFPYAPTLLPL
jgi:hypothetical protein